MDYTEFRHLPGTHPMQRFLPSLAFAAAMVVQLAATTSTTAQTYPSRPLTMIVPLAPGDATDVTGRIMAETMPEALGAFQKAEIDQWWPITRAAGIKAE